MTAKTFSMQIDSKQAEQQDMSFVLAAGIHKGRRDGEPPILCSALACSSFLRSPALTIEARQDAAVGDA